MAFKSWKALRSPITLWLASGVLALSACTSPSPPSPAADKAPTTTSAVDANAEMAHDFTLQTVDGDTVTLSDLRGQWVLLNFWATWCAPCVREMPYLAEVAQEREIAVLGVNFNETADTAAAYAREQAIDFPILLAPDDITLLMYEVRGLPRTIVISPDGAIAGRFVGELNPSQFGAWLDSHQVPRR
ncbi:MAG: redoxin domain-containing protein [Anaerolineales bacterium]|nr:redoxin domain-containing protein [Anaerolineales bacterium]